MTTTKALNIKPFDADILHQLKVQAARERVTIKALVTRIIKSYLFDVWEQEKKAR